MEKETFLSKLIPPSSHEVPDTNSSSTLYIANCPSSTRIDLALINVLSNLFLL